MREDTAECAARAMCKDRSLLHKYILMVKTMDKGGYVHWASLRRAGHH